MQDTLHIYTRVSSRIQDTDGTSLDTQRDLGISRSEEMGFSHKVWNEGGASSHHEDLENRPVLLNLLSGVENGSVKHLFVFNNDRLSRNEITAQTIRIALQRNDVVLYTKDGQFDLSNPSDKLFKTILDGIAQYDNALRTERGRLGKIARVKQGFWYGAPPPYGYELVDKKLSIHPEESKWIKKIFNWFYQGKSPIWIKSQLDQSGMEPRRKKGSWSIGSISRLSKNTHYIGSYTWEDKKSEEVITCTCPPIVDETVWNQVQEKRTSSALRTKQKNRTKHFYLLRDLMWCGDCGSKIAGRTKPSKNEQHYYCPNKERNWVKGTHPKDKKWKRGKVGTHGCSTVRSLNIPLTDKFVWNKVLEIVSESSILKEGFKKDVLQSKYQSDGENKKQLQDGKKKSRRLMKELQQVQSSIAEVETNNLLKRYDLEVYQKIKSNLDSELKSIKDKIEQTRIKTKELGEQKQWLDWIEKYHHRIGEMTSLSETEGKDYLTGILDRIEVQYDSDKKEHILDIKFKLPLVGDGIEYQDKKNKKKGYRVVEGDPVTGVKIPLRDHTGKSKVPPNETIQP